jgi:putative hemolysin
VQQLAGRYPGLSDVALIDRLLEQFEFRSVVRQNEKEHIPSSGKVVIVANHPVGVLDGLALLKTIAEIRSDVRMIGSAELNEVAELSGVLMPLDKGVERESQMDAIHRHLDAGGALIVFPAEEVARLGPTGIKDGRWRTSFLAIAELAHAPILPVFLEVRNSPLWHLASMIRRPLATLNLVRDSLLHNQDAMVIRVGELIDPVVHEDLNLPMKTKARLFRKQVYRVAKGKPSLFRTMAPVAHPESRQLLKREIAQCQILGQTRDDKKIYLYRYHEDSAIMREIGRLREEAFRLIGEGTGNRRDIDAYDEYYMHLVLWDDVDDEIVGAYRLCPTHQVLKSSSRNRLYTSTLFNYKPEARAILNAGLELGRSFVQPKYWGSRSLDYLWNGISALLRQNPQYRYLLGGVSISNSFSRTAKDMMVRYYQLYYGAESCMATCKRPYTLDEHALERIDGMFRGLDAREAFVVLKEQLGHMGYSVPTLYKQYTELSNPGGTVFHGFNIDPDFNDCVDGLVVVDITNMNPVKRKRFGLAEHQVVEPEILIDEDDE